MAAPASAACSEAGVMNLLSVGAAYGVLALAAERGWFGQLLGIDTDTPVPPYMPVMMVAILFGLSMEGGVRPRTAPHERSVHQRGLARLRRASSSKSLPGSSRRRRAGRIRSGHAFEARSPGASTRGASI
jgi:uncharacterized membrane protein YdfJ with MMPL/SSD domain